jgi:hypothetical protein
VVDSHQPSPLHADVIAQLAAAGADLSAPHAILALDLGVQSRIGRFDCEYTKALRPPHRTTLDRASTSTPIRTMVVELPRARVEP